jgi:phosphatase NudJ
VTPLREAIPTRFYVLAIVRRGDKFLVVQERKHGNTWYLPAGRVEAGESLTAGARRETIEEAGVSIELDGILRVEHTVIGKRQARIRVFFLGHAIDDRPPKQIADEHSLSARWVTLEELQGLTLRDDEVRELFEAVVRGIHIAPIELLETLWRD